MTDNFALHLPFNATSLGQTSFAIAKEIHKLGLNPVIFPIGQTDLSGQTFSEEFVAWLNANATRAIKDHSRKNPTFKLWHLAGSLESFSQNQVLFSFYEADKPTPTEVNIVGNQHTTIFSAEFIKRSFADFGATNIETVPLGMDTDCFFPKTHNRPNKDSVVFGIAGKLEHRKHHLKVLSAWAKKYGNNSKYFLNAALFNPFIHNADPNLQSQMINKALEGKRYWNINFIGWMPTNAMYNDFLNANDIMLAMSGGEAFGLPEFQSVAIGKHCVGMFAHGYRQWMTQENTVTIRPNGKIPIYDNIFFREGQEYNQGNIFDFDTEEFLTACDKAIEKFKTQPVNTAGLSLATQFTWKKTTEQILKVLETAQ